jgi:hypothetical protein
MREHEIKALMGYLARIADALEHIAGTVDHAPESMTVIRPNPWDGTPEVVPQRIRDLPDLAGYYYPEVEAPGPPRCGSIWDVEPTITCMRDEGHIGPHREVGGNAWGNYKDIKECDDHLTLTPTRIIYCILRDGHETPHQGSGRSWGNSTIPADDDPEQECADVSEARRNQ